MNIVITGASRGIGFETAIQLCSQGHHVFAVSRNGAGLEKLQTIIQQNGCGDKLMVMQIDINQPAQVKLMTKKIVALNETVDVLINNAGLLVKKNISELTDEEVRSVFETNVFAPFRIIRELVPLMENKDRTHIVNIGSVGGVQGSVKFSGLSAYSSSKGALAVLTETLAEELKEKNIYVNCLALGSAQTKMLEQAFPGFESPLSASKMAEFVSWFAVNGHHFFNGKIVPVGLTTP